jgi:hypothetical protein
MINAPEASGSKKDTSRAVAHESILKSQRGTLTARYDNLSLVDSAKDHRRPMYEERQNGFAFGN